MANYLVNGGVGNGTVTATYNFWGCNGAATGSGCDTSAAEDGATAPTVSPYAAVTASLNTTAPASGSTLTLTGGIFKDSTGAALSNLNAFTGVSAGSTTSSGAAETIPAGQVSAMMSLTGGASPGSATVAPPANAQATFSGTITSSGTGTVKIDNATVTVPFTVVAGPTSALAFSPATIAAGGTSTLTVTLSNSNSNTSLTGISFSDTLPTNVTGSAAATNCPSGAASYNAGVFSLSGATLAAGASCTATLTVTSTVPNTGYSDSVTASATTYGTGNTATASLAVTPGSATTFTVTGLGPFTAPGIAGTATVRAKDAYGNTATGYAGTVHLSSSDTLATLPANATLTSGVGSFSVTLNTASAPVLTTSVTATDTATSSITGSETAIFVGDSIWVVNSDSTEVRLDDAGAQKSTNGSSTGTSALGFVAFDSAGNAWLVESAVSTIQVYSRANLAVATITNGGVNSPVGIAIDGLGNAWVANGNNSVTEISNAQTARSPATGFQNGTNTLSGTKGIAIDNAGVVWVVNSTGNTVTKIFGGAAPAPVPLVTGSNNATLGARP